MSSFHAALLVIALFAPVVALIIWLQFFREGDSPVQTVPDEPANVLSARDVQAIEAALGVTLPSDYALFLQSERPGEIDSTTVRDDPDLIIELTRDYRESSGWPQHYVWVGDEADGCPYTLDCNTGEIFRLQKGNLQKPWDLHSSFSEFVDKNMS